MGVSTWKAPSEDEDCYLIVLEITLGYHREWQPDLSVQPLTLTHPGDAMGRGWSVLDGGSCSSTGFLVQSRVSDPEACRFAGRAEDP